MELEGLFTATKWEILKEISIESQSPLQLAAKLNTSIANVSQQLRLLEAAGIVQKTRLRQRDKGKPRVLFSLTRDSCYLVGFMRGFAAKKLLPLNTHKKFILRTWLLVNEELHEELLSFSLHLKDHFDAVRAVVLDDSRLFVLIRKGSKAAASLKKLSSDLKKLTLQVKEGADPASLPDLQQLIVLHDPDLLLLVNKGGDADSAD